MAQRLPRIAIGKVDGATCRFEDLQGGATGSRREPSLEIYTFAVEPRAAAKPGSAGKAGLNQVFGSSGSAPTAPTPES